MFLIKIQYSTDDVYDVNDADDSFWNWTSHMDACVGNDEQTWIRGLCAEMKQALQQDKAKTYYNSGGAASRMVAVKCLGCGQGATLNYGSWAKKEVASNIDNKRTFSAFLKMNYMPQTDAH